MSISLEIAGELRKASSALCVCRGEGTGRLEYVPDCDERETQVKEVVSRIAARREKCLFVCDILSNAYRPLVPFAAGFVFGTGTPLCHFASHLRAEGVPSCIDRDLWQAARSEPEVSGRLNCGAAVELTGAAKLEIAFGAASVRAKLGQQPLVLPIFDLAAGVAIQAERAGNAGLGEKALSVNALVANRLPTPAGLVLVNLCTPPESHDTLLAIVERSFPTFGRTGCAPLMVRPSFHGGSRPPPGAVKSRAVLSHADLLTAIAALTAATSSDAMSILIQERAPTAVRGILYTGRPWDFTTTDVVAALTWCEIDPNDRSPHHVELDPTRNVTAQLAKQLSDSLAAAFVPPLTRFIDEALALRDRYEAPLDIEFVVAPDFRFQFVQFRALYRG